ncbi:MAG TPA: M14 family metallocarboxypeptidase [Verrucomicrobiae bacterium]|nr:M14 family metallocarboxypeptidase [Verrucomicrobiae bacterium]
MSAPNQSSAPETNKAETLRRLGLNKNGYFGERIDLPEVLRGCAEAGAACGWRSEDIEVDEALSLPVFVRPGAITRTGNGAAPTRSPQVYISAGIHGDEPAGPLAVRQLLKENQWPPGFGLWVCPCLNPAGFRSGRRENASGLDLNRQYLKPKAIETAAHIAWLERAPAFDLCLCLHEDWEAHGFYVYELNPDNQPSLAEEIVRDVSAVCPIDLSELIEGRPARGGIIRPSLDPRERPDWPESFYLLTYKTRLSYTLEAPSDYALGPRVGALVTAVNTALRLLNERWKSPGPVQAAR